MKQQATPKPDNGTSVVKREAVISAIATEPEYPMPMPNCIDNEFVRLDKHHKYPTSKNYHRLFELLQTVAVVCFVDSHTGLCRDIGSSIWRSGVAQVGCRGICYVWAEDKKDFVKQCHQVNLEWLDPDRQA